MDSNPRASRQAPISDILQAYKEGTLSNSPVQRESTEDEEILQEKSAKPVQGKDLQLEEDEEPLQGKFESAPTTEQESVQKKRPNNTGLPDDLKTSIENFSGYRMDDVKVHYNSPKPTQLQALAYAQGTDIHLAPGQEKHLPHEAWHVVQQKQGRVQPTIQLQGINVNDNEALEKEADEVGETIQKQSVSPATDLAHKEQMLSGETVQMVGEKKFSLAGDSSNGEYKRLDEKVKAVKKDRKDTKQNLITEKLGDQGPLHFFKLKLKRFELTEERVKEMAKEGKEEAKITALTNKIDEIGRSLEGKGSLILTSRELSEFTTKSDIDKEIKNFVMDKYPESLRFNILEKLKPDYNFTYHRASLESIDELEDKVYALKTEEHKFATLLVGNAAFTSKEKRSEREIYTREDKEYVKDDKGVFTRRYAYVEKNLYQFMDFLNMGKMIGRYELLNRALGIEGEELRKKNRALTEDGKKRLLTNPAQPVDTGTAIAVQHQWMGTGLQQRGLSLASTPKEAIISNDGDSFKSNDGVRIKIDLAKIPEYKDEPGKKDHPMLINHYAYGGIKDKAEEKGIKSSILKRSEGVRMEYNYINSVTKNRELFLEFLKPEWIEEVTFHGKRGRRETVALDQFIKRCKEIMDYAGYERGIHDTIKPAQVVPGGTPSEEKGQGYGELYNQGYEKGEKLRPILETTKGRQKKISAISENDKNIKDIQDIVNKYAVGKITKIDFYFKYFADNRNKDVTDIERIGFAHGLMGGVKKDTFNEDFYKLSLPSGEGS